MTNAKHTPGPWYPGHLGSESSCQCRSIVDDGQYVGAIATVNVGNGLPIGEGGNDAPPVSEATANMHLIAAAPELLEALKRMLPEQNMMEEHLRPDFITCEVARAAIAKAEGHS